MIFSLHQFLVQIQAFHTWPLSIAHDKFCKDKKQEGKMSKQLLN